MRSDGTPGPSERTLVVVVETPVTAILAKEVVAGDVVVIRYEGPWGGPGMQEMLYPQERQPTLHLPS